MHLTGLGYFGIYSAKLDHWRRYAHDVLGLQVHAEQAHAAVTRLALRMDQRRWRIAVHAADHERFGYVGWELTDAAALDDAVVELEKAGVEVHRADPGLLGEREVLDLVWCLDPTGIRVELFYGAAVSAEPFVSPRGVRFVTGDQGLGHVVFPVDSYPETLRFYVDLLGMRVSDYYDVGRSRVAFLHTNPRHHSLAVSGLVVDPGRRPTRAPVPAGELFHFMLEVDDLDAVGRALDACLDGAAPVAEGLGRHSNDQMLSFYSVSPSGFQVEYGWGGLRVSDPHVTTRLDRTSRWGHRPLSVK